MRSELRAGFERDGFAIFDQILTPDEVARARAAMGRVYRGEYNADRRPPRVRKVASALGNEASVRWMLNARVLDADLWSISTDARLGEMAAGLLGTDAVSIVEDQLLDKPPGGLPVNLHQDYAYWPFSSTTSLITAWVALVDMTVELGALQLVRGSHRWGPGVRPDELIRGSEAEWSRALDASRPAGAPVELVEVTVPAGGGAFFHSLTFHGSGPNRSDACRHALSLHWAAAECRVNLAGTRGMDYPYFFARLQEGGPIENNYMPVVYRTPPSG